MKEIGGYIELDRFTGKMLYEDGIKLNCGRNALAYLIKAKNIKRIAMPRFMCDSCNKVLADNGVRVRYYSIGMDFKPLDIRTEDDEWFYVVNYYGQLTDSYILDLGAKTIIDNSQAYFQKPVNLTGTIYSCRKFFGVSDGAILYTDVYFKNLPQDESFEHINFLLGRYERSASEFYSQSVENNKRFNNEPIKRMSKLTENILHGIDYDYIKKRRTDNFTYLHTELRNLNKLQLTVPSGAFMYPFYVENGVEIRKRLQQKKIYIPILWPAVFGTCNSTDTEYKMAQNILPLPVDQRYSKDDMKYLLSEVKKCID